MVRFCRICYWLRTNCCFLRRSSVGICWTDRSAYMLHSNLFSSSQLAFIVLFQYVLIRYYTLFGVQTSEKDSNASSFAVIISEWASINSIFELCFIKSKNTILTSASPATNLADTKGFVFVMWSNFRPWKIIRRIYSNNRSPQIIAPLWWKYLK